MQYFLTNMQCVINSELFLISPSAEYMYPLWNMPTMSKGTNLGSCDSTGGSLPTILDSRSSEIVYFRLC